MTAPAPEATGTAVATTEKPNFLGTLPPQLQAALKIRQAEAMMLAEVSKQSWGEKLDASQRRAISAYCQRNNLDPSMIDLLGGKLYRNAAFYLDRLAKLVGAGVVEYAYPDYITVDPRLEKNAADQSDPARAEQARIERNRREDERVKWSVPDEALAACVFRVKLRGMDEIAGCKPVMASANDPVGKGNPATTAETRSARRCLRKLVEISPEVKQLYETLDVEWRQLADKVQVGDLEGPDPEKPAMVALPGGARIRAAGPQTIPLQSIGDGYADTRTTPASPAAIEREMGEEDDELELDQQLAAEEKKGRKGR